MSERMFPIQSDIFSEKRHPMNRIPEGSVPWKLAECAYEVYSHIYGTDQSLERLAERGGFGWVELTVFLSARRYPKKSWKAVVGGLFNKCEVSDA